MVRGKPNLWREVLDWGWAVIRHGLSVVAGVAITALVFVTEHYRGEPLTWVAAERILFASLAIAFFLAWREKHHTLNDADENRDVAERALADKLRELTESSAVLVSTRQELDYERQRNTPNLIAQIDRVLWGGDNAIGIALLLTITVRNRPPCAPSVAENWRVRVSKGEAVEVIVPSRLPAETTIGGDLQSVHWTESFTEKEAIYVKTKETPIEPGGSRTGLLLTILRGRTNADLDGAEVRVEYSDVTGKGHYVWFIAETSNFATSITYIPGTNTEYSEQSKVVPNADA